ncbi:YgfZ/GcvT domain-containing protein [Dyella acidiphila]|uniref:Folate-binding protein YgfZ n=1 Tax=Dyella acidiphila TaxID=2775866 RepID=A0ABR9GB42_9GAMM|nr:folate-binding protein YgfZ [Dyella acidiphila]MBE1161293.1 folate-binding protein YgfZ [Dyella acidiphila]
MQTSSPAQAIFIEGPDAAAFAHAQFTSQVTALPVGQWQFSSWLDAQGRVRNVFHLARLDTERFLVLLRGGNAAEFAEALRRFVFRSRVTLNSAQHMQLGTGAALPMHIVDADQNNIRVGCGAYALHVGNDVVGDDAWQLAQLHAGWPWLPDNAANQFLPPALSLHRLGAVALDKGCYPGQEIVARLHYRGGNKRHLHRIKLSTRVSDGAELQRDGREFVRLLSVIADRDSFDALAVITDETANNIAQAIENTSDDGIVIALVESWHD